MRGSGTLTEATWLRVMVEPYASTRIGSSRLVEARPVRSPVSSVRSAATAPCMRRLSSAVSIVSLYLVRLDLYGSIRAHPWPEPATHARAPESLGNDGCPTLTLENVNERAGFKD